MFPFKRNFSWSDYFLFAIIFILFLQITVFPVFLIVQLYRLNKRIQELELRIKEHTDRLSLKVEDLELDVYALTKNESLSKDVLEGFFEEAVGQTLLEFYTTSLLVNGFFTITALIFIAWFNQ